MPSSLHPPVLMSATYSLLALRLRITRKTIERSPAAQTASFLALLLVCPAALQIGRRTARLLTTTPGGEAFPALCSALLLLTLLYVALLLAGSTGLGGVMESPPVTVLRALPVPPGATLLADAVSFGVSLPTLFFIVALIPMITGWQSVVPLALLGAFAVGVALFLARLGTLIAKRGRVGLILATGALLLFGGVVLRAAPAAALSSVIEDKKPAVRLPWDPPPPPPPTVPVVLRNTPPGLAAQSLTGNTTAASLSLAATVVLTAIGTVLLDRGNDRTEPASNAKPNRSPAAPRRAGAFITEARLLLRNPSAHTPLRGPASLLLTVGYAWIAPNLGSDSVRTLADLLGMGATLYIATWQTQFVCNRFGSESGCAATLFSLTPTRWRILVTKNLALLALLFILDGTIVGGFALVAGNPRLVPTLLVGLLPVLILFTALGNLVSVWTPFPLARRTERFEWEPERSLMFVYVLVGIGTHLLFLPVLMLGQAWGTAGYLLGAAYVVTVYAASVGFAARLLTPARERRLVTLLDGVK
ncbi:MAG: hypothetical protein H8F28_21770 [Fibrella sp.]|nr:hypothetical protein [Armatimonadota bacterium]